MYFIIIFFNISEATVNKETPFYEANIVEAFFQGVCSQDYDITFACSGK